MRAHDDVARGVWRRLRAQFGHGTDRLGRCCRVPGGESGSRAAGGAGGRGGSGAAAGGGESTGSGGQAGTAGVTGVAGRGGSAGSGLAGSGGQAGAIGGVSGARGGAGGAGGVTGFGGGDGGTAGGARYLPPATARTDTIIDTGWRHLRSNASDAGATSFDDSTWTAVDLAPQLEREGRTGRRQQLLPGYRLVPPSLHAAGQASGKRVFLQFDGANIVATVYVNGTMVGSHRGGFARFRFDVTANVTPGADNVIAVQVSNASVNDVAPLDADFTFFGGLYRDVHVLVTDAVHADALDFSSSGLYVTPTNVTATSATLGTSVRVRNDQPAAQSVTVDTVVVRADGTTAARLSATGSVAAGASQSLSATMAFASPHLWNGVTDPYLYTAVREIRVGATVTDVVSAPLGFRFYTRRRGPGLFAQRPVRRSARREPAPGPARHGLGDHRRRSTTQDFDLIHEMGANAIRTVALPARPEGLQPRRRARLRACGRRSRWSTRSPTRPPSPTTPASS